MSIISFKKGRSGNIKIIIFVAAVSALFLALSGVFIKSSFSQASTITLDTYTLTFSDEFDTLGISNTNKITTGSNKKWIAHTPWGGDFGDAQFTDPSAEFPFTVKDSLLRIEARKDSAGKWRSGLIASMDAEYRGFGQQYGYFEMRAKMPAGPGLWPAFWLDSLIPKDSNDPSIEIDVIEHYGKFPNAYNSLVIVWPKNDATKKRFEQNIYKIRPGILYEDFHTYGVSVEADWIIYYFDRKEYWRVKTPPEHKHKLMILANLAMGSGWPIDQTPNPSYMYIDYIRAYQKK